MKNILGVSIVMITLLAAGCTTMTTSRTHPTISEELKRVDSVVIIPPRIEIEKVTLTGENERLTQQEQTIERELINIARRELLQHGYEVVEFDFAKEIESNNEFAYLVTQVRQGFDQAKKDLSLGQTLSKNKAASIQSSIGDAVNIVAERTGADAVLLMRYSGYKKSAGHQTKDIGTGILVGILTAGAVIPMSQSSGASTEVALIDGVTGDVLWADIRSGLLKSSITDMAMDSLPMDEDPPKSEAEKADHDAAKNPPESCDSCESKTD